MTTRLAAQTAFLVEADKLKTVERSSVLMDRSRPENSAEHSWHAALYALILAPLADPSVNIDRVIAMLLLHDLVEIDVGDHPIHIDVDAAEVATREAAAAKRIFGLLPDDQSRTLSGLWHEFEARSTPDAVFAKRIDFTQPIFQVLCSPDPIPEHVQIVRDNLDTGRASAFATDWPEVHALAAQMLGRKPASPPCLIDLQNRIPFLAEADALKTVLRATPLTDNSRPENSGEHSWHIALFALIYADQAAPVVQIGRVIRMLLLHDLVEIDAGDVPIHAQHDPEAQARKEQAAAKRLFGLLPNDQSAELHALWCEFEAAETPDAVFAKSIDRVQPLLLNMASGGGSWTDYNVTLAQIDTRVGTKVARGAPDLWPFIRAKVETFFTA